MIEKEKECDKRNLLSNCSERECSMIRVLICDDDRFFAEQMNVKVQEVFQQLGAIAKIHTYFKWEEIGHPILASCDLAILDIDFTDKKYTGVDIARRLRSLRKDAIIIFVTNYIEFAPDGYEVHAFRYILKSRINEKLEESLRLALSYFQSSKETMKIQINGELIDILLSEILYFESKQHMVVAYVKKESQGNRIKEYCFYATLSDIERSLEQSGFLRIHKSFVVNMNYLRKYQCTEAVLSNGIVLKVSEKNYSAQKKKYLLWRGR